ncbi:MAG: NAD(P)-dependent alcohol dehydrogenase, partial [Myxococcaceae bacterium]
MTHTDTSPYPSTVAVVRQAGAPLNIEQAQVLRPGPKEVLVRVVASGVCHTDMVFRDQFFPSPL